MSTGLSNFFDFNLWANLRLLDACEKLTDAQLDALSLGTYGTIRQTLMHLFASEEGYAHRWTITGPRPEPPLHKDDAFLGFAELRRRAEHSGTELRAVAEQVDLDEVLHLDDGTYDAAVIIVILQAIDHGIDHRSQIATMMSLLGVTPPVLDAWAYNDWLRATA